MRTRASASRGRARCRRNWRHNWTWERALLTIDHIWSAVLTFFTLAGGALIALTNRRADKIERTADAARDAIAAHKTYAAETFSRKDEFKEAVKEFGKRFDHLDEKLDEKIDEIKDRLPPRRGGEK